MKRLISFLSVGLYLLVQSAWADHPDIDGSVQSPDGIVFVKPDSSSVFYGNIVFEVGDIDGNGIPDLITGAINVGGGSAVGVFFDANLDSLDRLLHVATHSRSGASPKILIRPFLLPVADLVSVSARSGCSW